MTVHEYQSGRWTALVTDDALALLHPGVSDDVARELWQLTTTGRPLGAWVEYLATAGITALPSFAMVETHPEGLRVLVRGDVDVDVGGQVVTGRGYATWREEVLPAATDVTIRAEDDDGGWLPLTGGIVRAAAARLAVQQQRPVPDLVGTEDEDDDVELTVARMPALAAAVGAQVSDDAAASASPAGSVGTRHDDAAPPPAVLAAAAGPGAGTAATFAPPAGAPTGSDSTGRPAPQRPDDAADDALAATDAGDAVAAAQAADDDATAMADLSGAVLPGEDEEAPEESDDYDYLLWSTEQVRAHEAAQQPEPPVGTPEDPAPEPVPATAAQSDPAQLDIEATREPEPEEEPGGADPFAPGGIIDSVPGRARPQAPVGAPVDLPPPGGLPGADAPYDDGDHDGETITTAELPSTSTPIAVEPVERPAPSVELVLSTGPRIEMDRPVLLGRAPEATRFAGTEAPRLVSVANPERDISATHVEIRPAGGHVVVTDMNSTNGTVVHLPDQPSFRLQPGTGVPVAAGAVVELGAGVTVTVERLEGAQ